MAKRYFNWKLAVVLLMGLAVLSATAFGLRHWQRGRRASHGLSLGNKAYSEGRWQDAAEQLGQYLAVVQDDVPILLKYADSELNQRPMKAGNVQQAISAYRSILRLNPENMEAVSRLLEIYLNVGMYGEAEQIADKAVQLIHSAKLRRLFAISLAGQRKFTEAVKELENNIKDNPDDVLSYDVLGKLIEQRPEDFNVPSQVWFDEAVKNNPSSAQALIIRGDYYIRRGEKAKALADFAEAAKMDLSDPNLRLQIAENLVATGDIQQARHHIEIAAGQNPSGQNLWRIWAQLAIKSGSQDLMLEVADKGLKALSTQPWDFMPIAAELYIRTGKFDKATDCISQLRKKDIAPSTTAFLEGLLAEAKGQNYEAVKAWQNALGLGGGTENSRIMLANAYSNLGDIQSAIKQLRTLVSEQPNHVRANVDLAKLLGDIGRWDESLEYARAAVKLAPQDVGAALACARARMHLVFDGDTKINSAAAGDLDEYLKKLDNDTEGLIDVKLLELQLAIYRKDFSEAEILLGQLKNAYPSDNRVVLVEVNLLTARDQANEAVTILSRAVDKSPDSVILVRILAGLLSAQNSRQQCEDMIVRSMTNSRQPYVQKQLGLLLAGLYAGWNEKTKQCDLLARLGAQFPDDIPVLRSLLTCPAILNDEPKAQKIVDNIKTIEGQNGWQWRYEQARVWFAQDNFKTSYPQIVLLLKENLAADVDNQVSRVLLAAAYEKAGDMRLAIATYQDALNRSPGDVRIIVAIAGALYKVREYDSADQILQRAVESKPENPELKRLQFQSFVRRGEFDSAGTVLEDLFAADTNNMPAGLSLARLRLLQGRLDDAAGILGILDAKEPNSFPVAAAKVELNLRRGKNAEAMEICNETVRKLGDASALVLRARTFALLGQNDNAQTDFEQAAAVEPNNVEVWLAKSDFYRSIGNYDMAYIDMQRSLLIDQANPLVQKRAALLYLASADPARRRQGEAILDNALGALTEDVELKLYKARLLISQDTSPALENAKSILQTISKQQPANSEAWQLLAEVAIKQGQSAEAIDLALKGLAYRPKDKALLLLRAKLEKAHSALLAIPTLRDILELDQNDSDVAIYLAETYIDAGEHGEAITLLNKQLEIQNNPVAQRRLRVELGVAQYKAGDFNESQKIFDSLQQSLPNDAAPLLARVRLLKDDKLWSQIGTLVEMWCQSHPGDFNVPMIVANDLAGGQGDESKKIAEDLLGRILQQNPDSRGAIYLLATLLQTTGRSAEAAKLYQRFLLLDPNNVVAVNNLAWILCEDQNQYQKALELAERGLAKEPNYIDLLDTRGMAYYRLGRFESAVEDFNRCVTLYPAGKSSLTSSYFHLACALEKLGRTSQASENIKKALDLNKAVGGLTTAELTEARQLLQKLSEGGS
ncbi:MAG: tetratricopeptide repeat protein [Sedimentisphaerales bacterium]|jgi:tetratricopeptide (TPR) repeat protein